MRGMAAADRSPLQGSRWTSKDCDMFSSVLRFAWRPGNLLLDQRALRDWNVADDSQHILHSFCAVGSVNPIHGELFFSVRSSTDYIILNLQLSDFHSIDPDVTFANLYLRYISDDGFHLGISSDENNAERTTFCKGHARPFRYTHRVTGTRQSPVYVQKLPEFLYCFIRDEAAHNLSTLKFSQSTRSPDPADLTRIVTTTTTTTFSMTRDMAKGICQYFMDARLIENAVDRSATQFKDRGIYVLSPKGLHILERFITKNGISADALLKVFAEQPICMRLLHLERRASDDEILVTRAVLELLLRRFVGKKPNIVAANQLPGSGGGDKSGKPLTSSLTEAERAHGVPMWKHSSQEPISRTANPATANKMDFVFSAVAALEWLTDLTTIVGRDEAGEVAAHFVRCGFIALVPDRTAKTIDPSKVTVVRGAGYIKGQATAIQVEAEFRFGDRCIYKITSEGMRAARWEPSKLSNQPTLGASSVSAVNLLSTRSSIDEDFTILAGNASEERLTRKSSVADRLRLDILSIDKVSVKDSYTSKLRQVLEEPNLRSLFREFLRSNFCEENLSFWLDVQDFKRRFNTSSSAVAVPGSGQQKPGGGHAVMERHQRDLIAMAFVIYNTYLAPASACELNIDHNMRGELVAYMTKIVAEVSAKEGAQAVKQGTLDPAMAAKSLHASQLQTMVKLYERIQGYIFRLMATDSYISQAQSMPDIVDDEDDMKVAGKAGKGIGTLETEDLKSPSRSYITISQAANEKQAALLKSMGRALDENNARI
ncbi:hypothetical protein QFC22_005692 [Naganishia vaughanmartiniae]|uniref:Uncharacterized protein n=1 Tax=Naganishia vaughanmartiniae TaxID=1424756 RepID=A0ACC2WSS4_9TREE|nr:hypothetical protein QFC22_005692 [Naganishia vaughanmartiniae]